MKVCKRLIAAALAALLTLSLAACSPSGSTAEPLQIATKPLTEQYILGEMLKLVIESETDYTCEITKGIAGGTSNIMPAMESGEFDLYPEYTSSGYVLVLGHDAKGVEDDAMWEQLVREYQENYQMTWVGQYGFNNTYCVTVRGEVAREYGLETCTDLAAVADRLVFGGNPDYIKRADGFHLVCDTYGYAFKDVKSIDIGVKYAAMANGDVDVINGYTTDAQLGAQDVVALVDDKNLQVNYFCSTVVRQDTLAAYPGLEEALLKMDGILTDAEMAQLNCKVEIEGLDEATVARDYLAAKGVLAD